MSVVECAVVSCKSSICPERGKKIVLTPGAGAYLCACGNLYAAAEFYVTIPWFGGISEHGPVQWSATGFGVLKRGVPVEGILCETYDEAAIECLRLEQEALANG